MKLKSFGCSFIYGSDLSDNKVVFSYTPRCSKFTWPALLAHSLNARYQCFAYPGIGNLQIAEQLLNQVAITEPSLFVVNWTYIERFDYTIPQPAEKLVRPINYTHPENNTWTTIRPDSTSTVEKYYYQNLHTQYRDKLVSLMQIKLCIDALLQHGHKFIMTYMDELLFETEHHTSPAINTLQQSIRPYLQTFNGYNLLEYSQHLNYPISKENHPLEQAHQACFEYARDNFLKYLNG